MYLRIQREGVKERKCVSEPAREREREREKMCVCVCVRERERERERTTERMRVINSNQSSMRDIVLARYELYICATLSFQTLYVIDMKSVFI